MKNIDKIRQMNSDDLAEFICNLIDCESCKFLNNRGSSCSFDDNWRTWLEKESEE